jgi:hypothetical protein
MYEVRLPCQSPVHPGIKCVACLPRHPSAPRCAPP